MKISIEPFRKFIHHYTHPASVADILVITRPEEILQMAMTEQGTKTKLNWQLKSGDYKKARVVKVLNNTYIIIEENHFLSLKSSLVAVNEVLYVANSTF
ncbi:hypothetical protein [Chryseolinea lacunae]|uniref:Uncharacterized protein n=1 Tax=Chryseolinea lacunae TaxID=2801331 RepID=A0ABS1L1D7_9BACT|nr:hypothetical protein [Chryseolinea lacunae]MBL0744742.1 hypothetical protein [Chryseolinea lacunae]